jgi:type IV secretory pathway VirB2 component (pilin)
MQWAIRFLLSLTILLLPIAAQAQSGGTPFGTGFTAIQKLFTGTVAKVASLVAIVIGGYAFAHSDSPPQNDGKHPDADNEVRVVVDAVPV